jgi:hypothetical protein
MLDDRRGEFHHGDCLSADAEAHEIAKAARLKTHVHPPDNDRMRAFKRGNVNYEPMPYRARNHAIVLACNVLVAAPATAVEEQRSGTWATVRCARKLGKPVAMIQPGGTIKVEMNGTSYELKPLEARADVRAYSPVLRVQAPARCSSGGQQAVP